MDILQYHSVQSEEDAINTSFMSKLRAEVGAGGKPTGTFCDKHQKWKFISFLKQPSKAGNKVLLIVILRSLSSGLISKPLTFISNHN